MEKTKVQSYRRRIIKANNTLSALGDLFLSFEIDAMTQQDRLDLKAALLDSKKPVTYEYLNEAIAEEAGIQ